MTAGSSLMRVTSGGSLMRGTSGGNLLRSAYKYDCINRITRIPVRLLSTCFRLNSAYIENDHSKVLFTKLAEKNNYKYLDPDIHTLTESDAEEQSHKLPSNLIKSLQLREGISGDKNLQKEFETFKDWARSAQLRVVFLLHINENIHSKQYLTKVIQTLAQEDVESLQAHEMITLLLLIYFRRDMTVEDISEYLDLESLQNTLGKHLLNKQFSPEEIVAACLGLKKIEGLSVNSNILRNALFQLLNAENVEKDLKDFYFITLMTTLSRGGLIYHDNENNIEKAMTGFIPHLEDVSVMTKIKMMSFGISCGVELDKLSDTVCADLADELDQLNTKDILSLTNFFSKSTRPNDLVIITIKGEVSRLFAEAEKVEEIVDMFKILSHMANNQVYRVEVSKPILDAFCDILPSEVNWKNIKTISQKIIERIVVEHNNQDKILSGLKNLTSSQSGTICRVAAALCFNMRIDEVEIDHNMSMDTAAAILALFYKKMPMQLYSPQMSVQELDNRSRCIVNCYRGSIRFLGSERFCGVARLLPQFSEPDVVFGVLAGTPVQVPEYLTDPTILRPKRAPPGDWWVLVVANRKNLSSDQELIGADAIKVRQLKWLGFKPVVVPYSHLSSDTRAAKEIPRALRLEHVDMPNLDDGYMQETRKF